MKLSGLAWTAADYREAGQEIPPQISSNPSLTEGLIMTEDDIAEFIKDSIATLRILSDKGSERYKDLEASFDADLKYLVSIGQLDEEDYNELIQTENLHFS